MGSQKSSDTYKNAGYNDSYIYIYICIYIYIYTKFIVWCEGEERSIPLQVACGVPYTVKKALE